MQPDLTAIANAYGGEVRGDSAFIPTPGHSSKDRGTSLKLDATAPDGLLVHSFNGGDALAIKDDMRSRGLLPDDRGVIPIGRAKFRTVATYEYDDGDGNVIYRTLRRECPGEGKRFVAEHLSPSGEWIKGMGDLPRLPYQFSKICQSGQKAREAGEPYPLIVFVEGEAKADKLISMGFLATAIPFGCNGWRDEYAEALSGGPVAILPDNDDPGRAFAEQVRCALVDAGTEAFIVELPGLPPKGDIIDWQGTADDLRELIDTARAGIVPMLPLFDLARLDGPPPPARKWTLDNWIPEGELTLFTGPGGAGKSLFGQQLATSVALGRDFLGVPTALSNSLYISAEDDDDELHRRQRNICAALGASELIDRLHLSSLRGRLGNELCTFGADGRLIPSSSYTLLLNTIEHCQAGLVVLDNVAHLFTGNENDRGEVTQFANLLNRLAGETGAAILLVAHPNKAGDSYSGSTAWLNAVRSQIELQRDDENDPDARVLALGKANYARQGSKLNFRWHNFAFHLESDLPADQQAEIALTAQMVSDNDKFLDCLRERIRQQRPVSESPSSPSNYAPKIFASMSESKGIGQRRLERAMDRLFRIDAIERGELPWKRDNRHPAHGLCEKV